MSNDLVLTPEERARFLAQVGRPAQRAPRLPVAPPEEPPLVIAERQLNQALEAWHRSPMPTQELFFNVEFFARKLKRARGG